MFWHAKEQVLNIQDIQMNCITFGNGEKSLIIIALAMDFLETKSAKMYIAITKQILCSGFFLLKFLPFDYFFVLKYIE